MAIEEQGRAPYASTGSILEVLKKHRQVGLSKIDATVLDQLHITESLRPRTLASLVILGFIDENGATTTEFKNLSRLSEEDYLPGLADLLQEAYAPVLRFIGNPAEASVQSIEGAFRAFTPTGQLDRMVQLFIGLMAYVGLMPEPQRRRSSSGGPSGGASRPRRSEGQRSATRKGEGQPAGEPRDETPVRQQPNGPAVARPSYSRTVQLSDGRGSLTVDGEIDLFALKGRSRDLVFRLIDLLDEYEAEVEPSP